MIGFVESETIEFKQEWSDRALEDLCAFSNLHGGSLFLGVRDNGDVVGFDVSDRNQQRISNLIYDSLRITPGVVVRQMEGFEVLEVRVLKAAALVACRGRYLTRVGTTNRDMTPAELAARALELSGQTWDALPEGSIDLVAPELVQEFVNLSYKTLPFAISAPPLETLQKLGYVVGNRLTRAGFLAFTRTPQERFFGARIRVGRFKQGDLQEEFIGMGGLFRQLSAVLDWLRPHLFQEMEYPSDFRGESALEALQRREKWEIPFLALREALLNALIHRDYSSSDDIQVRLSEEKLEIWNPGRLPVGITLEELRQPEHTSVRRNPKIAEIFFYMGWVERWGSGVRRMQAECLTAQVPPPEFAENSGGVITRFSRRKVLSLKAYAFGVPMNDRQQKAILHLSEGHSITRKEYETLTGASKATAARDLSELVHLKLIEAVGEGKRTFYRLADDRGQIQD